MGTTVSRISCGVTRDQEVEYMSDLTKVTKTKTGWMNRFWNKFSDQYCMKRTTITPCKQEARLLREISLMEYIEKPSELQEKMDDLYQMYLQDGSMFDKLCISDDKIECLRSAARFEDYFKGDGDDDNWKDKDGTVIDPTDEDGLWHELTVELIEDLQEPYEDFRKTKTYKAYKGKIRTYLHDIYCESSAHSGYYDELDVFEDYNHYQQNDAAESLWIMSGLLGGVSVVFCVGLALGILVYWTWINMNSKSNDERTNIVW
eukprot:36788_1